MVPVIGSSWTRSHLSAIGTVICAGKQYGLCAPRDPVHVDALDRGPGASAMRMERLCREGQQRFRDHVVLDEPGDLFPDQESHHALAIVEHP